MRARSLFVWYVSRKDESTFFPSIKSRTDRTLQMRAYGSLLEIVLLSLETGGDISSSARLSKHVLSLPNSAGLELTGFAATDLMSCSFE